MGLVKITALLSQTIGLDADVVSPSQINRAAETRRVACNLSDLDRYWARLQTSATELEELIELIIVPETWFFRDRKPFDYLKNYVASEYLLKPNRNTLQLLSVPSSTDEEPYSIAISLLESGLQPKQFNIDAIDISQRSLTKARRGIYSKNSFRGDAWQERSHYFQHSEQGYELSKSIRDLVNFQQGNVMTALALNQKQYDIIFGYRKSESPIKQAVIIKSLPRISPDIQPIKKTHLSTNSNHQSSQELDLRSVRKLADDGRLIDATTLCKTYLEKYLTSADAYVLLGELYQADHQNSQAVEKAAHKAEQCFQRAIYLEPNSYFVERTSG